MSDVDRRRALGLGALATLLYLMTPPALVNLDGLGYLKLLPHNFAAGHLLFMPALRAMTRLHHGDGLQAGRLYDAILGGTGVVLIYGIARRLFASRSTDDGRFAATLAAAGLAVSYGYWIEANDVEAYAAATVALLATVRMLLAYATRPSLQRALAAGALLGIAVLCHVQHVLLALFVTAYIVAHAPRASRVLHAIAALTIGGAIALGAYAYAALIVRGHDLRAGVRWVLTAQHGFRETAGVYRVADAVYGAAKALVWAPYLHEADAPRLLGQFLLGLAPLVALIALAIVRRRQIALEWRLGLVWIAPYALFAIAFFGADPERWLFVLPAGWLVAGAALATLERRALVGAAVIAYLVVINLATGILPARRDTDGTKWRAETAARELRAGDLVVFPGHAWDEYVSAFAPAGVEPVPLAYYCARDGVDAGVARLGREIDDARARGARIMAARLFDEIDDDRRGWDELQTLGLDRADVRARVLNARPRAALAPRAGDARLVELRFP